MYSGRIPGAFEELIGAQLRDWYSTPAEFEKSINEKTGR